jgi:hypothetical protein
MDIKTNFKGKIEDEDFIEKEELIIALEKSKLNGKYILLDYGFCICYFIKYVDNNTFSFIIDYCTMGDYKDGYEESEIGCYFKNDNIKINNWENIFKIII